MQRQVYTFGVNDTSQLLSYGYEINTDTGGQLHDFINSRFPNLNLVRLIAEVEEKLTPVSSTPVSREISFDTIKNCLRIVFHNRKGGSSKELAFIRKFELEDVDIVVHHQYCIVPVLFQGKGLIRAVFKASLQEYLNINLSRIYLTAGRSAGGYAWAKFGFVATDQVEVQAILHKAFSRLSKKQYLLVFTIYEKYYTRNPAGKEFPMILWANLPFMKAVLTGTSWQGMLDLRNREQITNFMNYVSRA